MCIYSELRTMNRELINTHTMYTQLIHATLITLTLGASFVISKSYLAQYELFISALLFIIFFLSKRKLPIPYYRVVESIIYTFIVSSVVLTTGGSNSPLFFLLYFLLFALSLLLEPLVSLTTALALLIFYFLSMGDDTSPNQLLSLLSLLLITPFALFIGKEYLKVQQSKQTITDLTNSAVNTKKDHFLFLSLVLKNHVQAISNAAQNFLGDHDLDTIKKQAKRMETLIDEYEKQI